MSSRRKNPPSLQPRLRIVAGGVIAFGPGKADLLRHIVGTGSIAAAARAMDMSYMRAWSLVQTMNGSFCEPLVETVRGSTGGGGARLTPTGEAVLKFYQELEAAAVRATEAPWSGLSALLKG